MTTNTVAFAPLTADTLGLPTPAVVSAAIPLFVIGLLLWRRVLPRLAAVMALLAGAALTRGWLYTAIHALVGGATTAGNAVTRTTMGGAVPGALAIILTIYYVLQLRLDPETVNRLLALRDRPRAVLATRRRGGGRSGTVAFSYLGDRDRPRWPRKLGALGVGLVLPSVVSTIPGTVGAITVSATNLVGGLMAAGLDHTIGIR